MLFSLLRAVRVGLGLALLVCAAAGAQPRGLSADELFGRGVQLHQAGDIVGAIEAYEAALLKEPGRVDALSNLGACYVRLGRYDDAIQRYRAALEREPAQVQVRFNLALALYKAARIQEAATELETVVERDPSQRNAVLVLADCRLQLGAYGAVVALLGPREEEFKDDRLYAYLLGNALIQRNELMKGQSLIDRLFRGGESAEGHLLMGAAHLQRKDYPAALPELQRAVEMGPELPTVHALYGQALLRMGRRDEAVDAFRRELLANPNDFDSNLYLGLLLREDQKLDQALEHLQRAGRLRARHPAVLYGLGAALLLAGRVDEAQAALEGLIEQVPSYRQGHVLLATAYYRQKKKDLGDRERALAEKLRAEQQAKEPGASDDLGPAYTGEEPTPGQAATPAPTGPGR